MTLFIYLVLIGLLCWLINPLKSGRYFLTIICIYLLVVVTVANTKEAPQAAQPIKSWFT